MKYERQGDKIIEAHKERLKLKKQLKTIKNFSSV